uniref:non-specific serine/threonine protein kinase n=2 Tax=Setaria italica TaxID=4555 RepID=K4A1U7_SETIT
RRRNGPLLPLLAPARPPRVPTRARTPRRIARPPAWPPIPNPTAAAAPSQSQPPPRAMAVDRVVDAGEEAFEEVDPTGRFGRYADVLGLGSVKKVYRGFDQEEGIEVAWNRVRLRALADRDPGMVDRLHAEVRLLRSLHHDHIIGFHKVWLDRDAGVLNFITEVCTSGSLREYRQRHRHVSVKALKKWARQILEGLNHLHTHDPCIIHRDLNCSNVFINGNNGQVKIGDLGLAAIVDKTHVAHTILGTPEFMAPELYTETYTESVDIYSYGMCVLEMVTREVPYAECGSVVQIFHNVTRGVPPAALKRLKDPELRGFIERCIGQPRNRPSAAELLEDPFFNGICAGDDDALADAASVVAGTPVPRPRSYVDDLAGLRLD